MMMWFWQMLGWRCYQIGTCQLWVRGTYHLDWERDLVEMVKNNDKWGGGKYVYDYRGYTS